MFYTPQSTRTGTESPAIASRSQSIMSTTSNQVQVRPQITVSDVLLMDVVMMGREGGIQLLEYQNVIRNVVIVDDPTVSLPCPVVLQIDSIGVQLSAGRLTALSPVLSIPMCAITKLQTFVEWNMLGMCGLKLCGPDGFVCLLGLTDGRMRSALHKVIAIRSGALLPQRPTTPGRASSTSQQKPSSRANTPSASRGPSKSPSRVIVSSKKLSQPRSTSTTAAPTVTAKSITPASSPARERIPNVPTTVSQEAILPEDREHRRLELLEQATKHRSQQYTAMEKAVDEAKAVRRKILEQRMQEERVRRSSIS